MREIVVRVWDEDIAWERMWIVQRWVCVGVWICMFSNALTIAELKY